MGFLDLLKSKTVWGTIVMILGYLSQPDVLALLHIPERWSAIIIALGGLLTAIGVRTAIQKSGPTN